MRSQTDNPPVRSVSSGFSLIEVLVAMTILSAAAVALIQIAEQHAARLERLETVLIADTVAANRLVELRRSALDANVSRTVEMADQFWRVETRLAATSDPELAQVNIEVFGPKGTAPVSQLTSFIDTRAKP